MTLLWHAAYSLLTLFALVALVKIYSLVSVGRDVGKARTTAEEIERDTGVRATCMHLDLCSFASIRQFAQQVVLQEVRLDVLINNAGILRVTANCLHPGVVKSHLADSATGVYAKMGVLCIRLFGKSVKDGAQTSVYLAVSEEVEGISGKMFADCKPSFAPGKNKDAESLWDVSQRLVGLR
ncbi:hypothetical protein HPB50_021722 [Hyalomma asiaticum]|uniref:Uncharacterized protein n=1 Tax=Hyalomma asiaticum TaxID=266040 RepID=A0ACB7T8T4_HYAAI|nr:hypothetical protein HPB50_021722 [Hyalomma asiaticum]